MKILVACEESGRVTEAFRKKGHEAFSCDLKPTTGNLPPLIETCQGKAKNYESWTMKTRSAAIRSKTFQEIAEAMAQQWNF